MSNRPEHGSPSGRPRDDGSAVHSLILQTATVYLLPLMILFSIFLLLRGHDEPGGGFVAGLTAAAALSLHALAYDVPSTRKVLRIDPRTIIAWGVFFGAVSGLLALLSWPALGAPAPYLAGQWLIFDAPAIGQVKLGSPLVFDIGVYLTVAGVTLMIVLELK